MLDFIGRLHVLVLHLPIGILFIYVLLVWTSSLGSLKSQVHFRKSILGISVLAAFASCLTGYLLSSQGDYAPALVERHQWVAIVFSLLLVAGWLRYPIQERVEKIWSVLVLIGVMATGHIGGSMTHGEDFLFASANEQPTAISFANTNLETAVLYKDFIQPIFDARCVKCHGEKKRKGKLRMDTYSFISEGGRSGELLHHDGDILKGDLYNRMILPLNHKDHMPPKSKSQLSTNHLALIKWWLMEGADEHKLVSQSGSKDSLNQLLQRIIEEAKLSSEGEVDVRPAYLPEVDLDPLDPTILTTLAELDIVALQAGNQSQLIELNFVNVTSLSEEHWSALIDMKEYIVRLKLSDQPVNNEDLEHLQGMTNLVNLYLDGTNIGDEGAKYLGGLPELKMLNVNRTTLTAEGVKMIASAPNLRKIYAYGTNIESDILSNQVQIEIGGYEVPTFPEDTLRIPQ